jgi:hypothetical protein
MLQNSGTRAGSSHLVSNIDFNAQNKIIKGKFIVRSHSIRGQDVLLHFFVNRVSDLCPGRPTGPWALVVHRNLQRISGRRCPARKELRTSVIAINDRN